MDNLSVPTKEATLYMERQTKLNFAKQSDPDGAPWAVLSPSTLARKKTNAILRETSTLVNSVNSESSAKEGRVFATTGYGLYHQTGTTKMPQRKFLGFGAEDVDRIPKFYTEYLDL